MNNLAEKSHLPFSDDGSGQCSGSGGCEVAKGTSVHGLPSEKLSFLMYGFSSRMEDENGQEEVEA